MSAGVAELDGVRPESASAIVLPLVPLAWVALAVASLWLRLGAIDAFPLAPDEAARALEARAIWRGEAGDYRAGPLLSNLVAVWTALFTPADGPARTPSALAGWALCLTPLLLRGRLGSRAALASSLLLALSPVQVLASRSVHPAVVAALAVAIGLACLLRTLDRSDGRWLLGVGAAAAIGLGTTHLFVGQVVAVVLALAIWPPLGKAPALDLKRWGGRAALVGLAAAAAAHTLLFTRPSGVQAGLVEPFPLWLGSIGLSGATMRAGSTLWLHELALVGLAVHGAVRCRSDRRTVGFLSVWALTSALLGLLTRTPDLTAMVGPTLPLALLGGMGLAHATWLARGRRTAVWMASLAALVPVVFFVVAVNGAVQRGGAPSFAPLAIALGGLIAVALVAGAWLERVELAVAGGLALATVLGAIWLASLTRLNYASHERGGPALLGQSARPELYEVREQVLDWWRQDPRGVVRVDASLRPVLEWTLRDGPPIEWISAPPPTAERAILGGLTSERRPAGQWLRSVVAERYQPSPEPFGPEALWRWFVQRQPIVRIEPHAILLPH